MSKELELPSDSEDDDEDYVPEGADSNPGSEVESDGDVESGPEENDENVAESKKRKSNGRKQKKGRKKQKRAAEEVQEESKIEKAELSEEQEKKRADSLWADFMKDTGAISKPKPKTPQNSHESNPVIRPKMEEKVKITKIFEFAGEEVKIEKEVAADSAEARLTLPDVQKSTHESESTTEATRGPSSRGRGAKRIAGLGGISSVLGQLGKKAKISTLEKSKLDWDNFKKEEKIDEEINTHNKGKDGYLERQDFLQRADVRQFEIEKQLRQTRRSNR